MQISFPRIVLIALTCIIINTLGCKRSDGDNKPVSIEGVWQTIAYESTQPTGLYDSTSTDLWSRNPPCVKDDYWVFKPDHSIEFNEGGEKCDDSHPQTEAGTWSIHDATLNVSRKGEPLIENGKILQLDATTLKVIYPTYFWILTGDKLHYTAILTMTRR